MSFLYCILLCKHSYVNFICEVRKIIIFRFLHSLSVFFEKRCWIRSSVSPLHILLSDRLLILQCHPSMQYISHDLTNDFLEVNNGIHTIKNKVWKFWSNRFIKEVVAAKLISTKWIFLKLLHSIWQNSLPSGYRM